MAWALAVFTALRHYLLRDRPGRDAYLAWRFAPFCRGGSGGHAAVAAQLDSATDLAHYRRDSGRCGQLFSGIADRPQGFPLRTGPLSEQEASRAHSRVLREARWQNDHFSPLY